MVLRYLLTIIAALAAAVLIAASLSTQEAADQPSNAAATATTPPPGTAVNHYPRISIIYPKGGEVLSGTVTIRWEVTDPDGDPVTVTVAVTDDPFPSCVACPPQEWEYIIINGSGTATIEWDTTSLPDGEYMLMIEAYDGKDLSRAYSDWFVIDNG